MLDERDSAVSIVLLFIPREAPAVGFQAGDYVVQAIPIDVVDAHFSPANAAAGAGPAAELRGVIRPRSLRRSLRWLLPPTGGRYDIDAAVSIDITCADAVLRI